MATVLLVSSEPSDQLTVVAAEEGHNVVEVATVGEALQQATFLSPDVVIMPDDAESVDGVDPLPIVRRDVDATIIAVGTGEAQKTSQALFNGADSYLKRPVDRSELRGRLRSLLRRRALLQQNGTTILRAPG